MTAAGALPAARPLVAAVWMAGAIASFTTLAVAGRTVSVDLSTFEIMLWRSLIGLSLLLAYVALRSPERAFTTDRLPLHLLNRPPRET